MISSECVQCTPAVNLHNVNKLTFDPLRMCTIYRNLSQYTPYNNNFHLSLYMCIISTSRTCVPCSPLIFPILAWLCCTCLHVYTFCACVQVYTCCNVYRCTPHVHVFRCTPPVQVSLVSIKIL